MGKPKILPGKYYLSQECGPSHTLESPGRMNKRRSPQTLDLIGPHGAQTKVFFKAPRVFSVGHKLIHTQARRGSVIRSRHCAWIQDH